ncbi:hypothetical protein ACB098_11G098100 [Castanea mollissima]
MREQPRPQQQILRQRDIYLPDDLVINNILTRLPVKSVMRFRCVCKSWYSSIKPSDFIDTHLSNYKDSHDINGYVIHMPSKNWQGSAGRKKEGEGGSWRLTVRGLWWLSIHIYIYIYIYIYNRVFFCGSKS